MKTFAGAVLLVVLGMGSLVLFDWERPPMETVQLGYRGVGMEEVINPRTLEDKMAANVPPEPIPAAGVGGPKAADIYQNVRVLGDLSVGQFNRLMVAMTNWIAPEEGCAYCHAGNNFASEDLYTKIVARRMLQMTQHINDNWQPHVANTGVTCYTCHRGQAVPQEIWFTEPGPSAVARRASMRAEQNLASDAVAKASLPYDPFTPFLLQSNEIRIIGENPLPAGNRTSTKQAEWTYGLMMHMSSSLGVNCTYCHNSRSFAEWEGSTPQRVTAWHGIRMVRDLNVNYLEPLGLQYPAYRVGPTGDAPKANCGTCHLGVHKPLYGASMLADYPSLGGAGNSDQ